VPMLNFINIGTFFIEFQFSIVGSTDTEASASTITRVCHSSLAAPCGAGLTRRRGGGVVRNDSCPASSYGTLKR
jgi:hypothetical protein